MLHAMQTGLAVARSHRNSDILSRGKFPKNIEPTTLQAFNLATICGARAIGLENQVGSLREGKLADVLIFNSSSPAMSCVADENPLVAVVRHGTPQDVETVIIGGDVRKENGVLANATCEGIFEEEGWGQLKADVKGRSLSWANVAEELKRSRVEVQKRIDRCNIKAARVAVIKMWGMPDAQSVFV